MRKLITIPLPPPLLKKAEEVARKENRTKSELPENAITRSETSWMNSTGGLPLECFRQGFLHRGSFTGVPSEVVAGYEQKRIERFREYNPLMRKAGKSFASDAEIELGRIPQGA